jgi:hypothetical protein
MKTLREELEALLTRFGAAEGIEDEIAMHMLADLRHICHARGWDYAERDQLAHGLYLDELDERLGIRVL